MAPIMTASRREASLAAGSAGLFLAIVLSGTAVSCGKPPRRGFPGDRIELPIRDVTLQVEVASDRLSQQLGLMHRETLPEMSGMLFIYQPRDRRRLSFWMRDTLIPLSIAFLDDDGKVLQIEDMRPKDETSIWSKTEVRYALEVNRGWFARHGVNVGDSFTDFRGKVRAFDGP
jgi:uncharacterized membrane protein (UPF0127 family)